MKIKKVLCPTDFSEAAAGALEMAFELASEFNAKTCILNVQEIVESPLSEDREMAWALEELDELRRKEAEAVEKKLDGIASPRREELTISCKVVQGDRPYRKIVEFARREDVDIIVMGTNGRSNVKELLLGSNTERVLRTTDIPVLVVP